MNIQGLNPKIIFEDEYLAVIDKPAGMVTNDSQTTKDLTVQQWFARKFSILNFSRKAGSSSAGKLPINYKISNNEKEFLEKQGIVHRLDKETSGVLVLAKTSEAYEGLKKQFLERKVKKTYAALVHGRMAEQEGIISAPIDRHPGDRHKFAVVKDGSRAAITEWKVVGEYKKGEDNFTLLDLMPMTGRTHQIRVHLQYLGHPIVGDPVYGFQKQLKKEKEWCPRMFLIAKSLALTHPITGAEMIFKADFPDELSSVLEYLVH